MNLNICTLFLNLIYLLKFVNCRSDYCSLQTSNCYGRNHIGCANSEFPINSKWTDFKLIDMTPALRSFILTTLNEYRNNIALGNIEGFPEAEYMLYLGWLWEFEYLMEEAVMKTSHANFYCIATDDYKRPYEINFKSTGHYNTSKEFIQRALNVFMKKKLTSVTDRSFSSLYMADTFKIGCAYATYYEGGKKRHILKCMTNEWGYKTISDAYDFGEACSSCPDKRVCGIYYSGLCFKYGQIGSSGGTGQQGLKGPPGRING